MSSERTWATWVFQVAGINKPQVSVSKLNDSGWKVIFDDERSYLLHKATGHTMDLVCERGIFTIHAFIEPGGTNSSPVFKRPESNRARRVSSP